MSSPQMDTRVHLYLSDFPLEGAAVAKVLVTFTRIEIYVDATQRWITVVDYGGAGRQFDLLTLQGGNTAELGAFDLEPGSYSQIRLQMTPDHIIEVDSGSGPQQLPLKIPSGDQTGIKLVHPFTVSGEGPTKLTLDFDAQKSIHGNRGQGYVLKPTIKVIEVVTSEFAAKEIRAAEGGEVHLLGKAQLRIPPGALAADTLIAIRELKLSEPYARRTGLLPGAIIQLEPSGLSFRTPAQLSLFYDPAEIPPGLTPQDLTLVSHNRGEAWREHPSVVAVDPRTISTSVTHFTSWAAATEAVKVCPPGSTLESGDCFPVGTLTFQCRPTVDSSVEVYDAGNTRIFLREISWTSDAPLIATAVPRSVTCDALSGDPVACDGREGCGSDEIAPSSYVCIADPRYMTLTRPGCGDARLTVRVVDGNPLAVTSFGVHTPDPYRFALDSIEILNDSDPNGSGEMYWKFRIDEFAFDHSRTSPVDANSGGTIQVGESAGAEVCRSAFHVQGFLADQDGFLEDDEITNFDFGLQGPGPGIGQTFGEPDGKFHWDIQACP